MSDAEVLICIVLLGIVAAIAARSSDPAMRRAHETAVAAVSAAYYKAEVLEELGLGG